YVDERGRELERLEEDTGRRVTIVREGAEPVAGLLHASDANADPELVRSVTAAARIAVANVHLQAEVRRQVGELESSRRRIVEATDAERRRLEQDLRDGGQRRP